MSILQWFRKAKQVKAKTYENTDQWAAQHFPDSQRDIARRVADILVEQVGVDLDSLTPMTRFIEDLRMTDLEPVEVVMALEVEFGLSIPGADFEPLETITDLVQYLYERVQHTMA